MSDFIPPALMPNEWERVRSGCDDVTHYYFTGDKGAVIAACNDELPDTDPRKITREWVKILRATARWIEEQPDNFGPETELRAMADALESYLPPP
jgi:hypothetical protein